MSPTNSHPLQMTNPHFKEDTMVKIGSYYIFKEDEVDHLLKYAKIDKAFKKKGITPEDITGGKLHLHRNPPKGLKKNRRDHADHQPE